MIHLLLTAAVTPASGVGVAIQESQTRLTQYVHALQWWQRTATDQGWTLWLVETSGYDGAGLRERLADPSCYLDRPGTAPSAARGKGALEADAIDASLSELLARGIDDSETVFKVTGRLWMENAARILRPAADSEIVGRRRIDRTLVDTRLIGARIATWQSTLHAMAPEVDEAAGRNVEHVAAHRIYDAEYDGTAHIAPFCERVVFAGVSGTRGVDFGGPRERGRALFGRPAGAVATALSERVFV